MKFTLPQLNYEYGALEPFIDAKTMEIHHSKHHQAYIDNLNKVMEKYPKIKGDKLEILMENLDKLPFDEKDQKVFINNGGGHLNHSFFWTIMSAKKEINEKLTDEIKKVFGSLDEFKAQFKQAALTRFGSGWAWLVYDKSQKLNLYSTANQDSPYLQGHKPVIGIDIWEHAYYLKYQNKRAEYIDNWWNVLKLI